MQSDTDTDNGITPDPIKKPTAETGITATPAAATAVAADQGLPPVAPPSGKFILQLFLVPGLIVSVAVGLLLLSQWILGTPRSPTKLLKGLDDPNPEVRWRTAADVAQLLPRDEKLATDAWFALEVTDRLQKALAENKISERVRREQLSEKKSDLPPIPKPLQTEREFILYLISCLGSFEVPVGAPLLSELAAGDQPAADGEAAFRRRARAAWSLLVLGGNLKKFDKLSDERKGAILGTLREEAAGGGARARWARESVDFLEQRKPGRPARGVGAGEALVRCASAEAPFLRELAGGALSFWDAKGAEDALEKLVKDDGHGTDPVERDESQAEYRKNHPAEVRARNQKTIAYNAVLTLVRRGSARVKNHFDLIKEMLDEEKQRAVWKSGEPNQKGAYVAEAREVVLRTLQALDQLRRESPQPQVDLSPLRPIIDNLADSPHAAVSAAAKELQKKL
jgi:hypothetical protein